MGLALRLLWQHSAVERIVGVTDVRNAASVRLLECVGLRPRGTREVVFKGETCVEQVHVLQRPTHA